MEATWGGGGGSPESRGKVDVVLSIPFQTLPVQDLYRWLGRVSLAQEHGTQHLHIHNEHLLLILTCYINTFLMPHDCHARATIPTSP